MNAWQKGIILAGTCAVFLVCMCPPWRHVLHGHNSMQVVRTPAGYGLVCAPLPSLYDSPYSAVELDLGRLGLQLLAVGAVVATALLLTKQRHKPPPNPPPS